MSAKTLSAAALERRYRAAKRKEGVDLTVISLKDWSPAVLEGFHRACERRQISPSEYVREALWREKERREELISRQLTLPAHVWQFIEQEADSKYGGDVARVVHGMYDQARTYRAMMELPARKKARKS